MHTLACFFIGVFVGAAIPVMLIDMVEICMKGFTRKLVISMFTMFCVVTLLLHG